MKTEISHRDLKNIQAYINGGPAPKGLPKVVSRLEEAIYNLEEYLIFDTAGSSTETFRERLKFYRGLRSQLKLVINWHKEMEENNWMKDFYEIGAEV